VLIHKTFGNKEVIFRESGKVIKVLFPKTAEEIETYGIYVYKFIDIL